jgi:hypothetical protein
MSAAFSEPPGVAARLENAVIYLPHFPSRRALPPDLKMLYGPRFPPE